MNMITKALSKVSKKPSFTSHLEVATACHMQAKDFHYIDHEFDRTPLGDAVDKASMKLLKETYLAANDKNVVASPLGVLLLLSMYSSGAARESRDEIIQALHAANYTQLFNSYSRLSEKFSTLDSSYFTLANKIYVSNQYTLANDFSDTTVRSYHSEVEKIDFANQKTAAATINQWADKKTKGYIKSPVTENVIDPSAAAALFNVIFFQGHWNVPFNVSETEDKKFHVDKFRTVKKPTMHLRQSLFYHKNSELGAQLIELPYKEKGFRMVIVLPDKVDGLPSVLEKVEQNGLLSDVFALSPTGREVNLYLPKFHIDNKLNLNQLLPKVGVSRIFKDEAPGIVKETGVKVSTAFQEAFVKVDEEGATAGAFTGFIMVHTSLNSQPPPPLEFKVNRPFLFVILHEDIVLFAGTYSH